MVVALAARIAAEEAKLAASLERASAAERPSSAHGGGLRLAPLTAVMQYLIDRGAFTPEHVAYQMIERLLFGALGREDIYPDARYNNLREFAETLRYHGGAAVLHELHGQGLAGDAAAVGGTTKRGGRDDVRTATEYLSLHNTGMFHPVTVQRSLSTSRVDPGVLPHEMLNLFDALSTRRAVSWQPETGEEGEEKRMYPVVAKTDGMLLGQGAAMDQAEHDILGFEKPISYEEAKEVMKMDDEELPS